MKQKAIIISNGASAVRALIAFLQAEGIEVVCLQCEADAARLPNPQESPLILLVIPDEFIEDGYAQLCEWKEIYPTGNAMLLPMGSSENWETAVTQVLGTKKGDVVHSQPQEDQVILSAHAELVDEQMQQLIEKLGPAAADYFEEIDGVGYRFKHDGPIVKIDTQLLRLLGYGLGDEPN